MHLIGLKIGVSRQPCGSPCKRSARSLMRGATITLTQCFHADGTSQRSKGYCIDVLFDNAIRWMESQRSLGQPFFCYLPMNVVHGPQWALPERRQAIAKQLPKLSAERNWLFGHVESF